MKFAAYISRNRLCKKYKFSFKIRCIFWDKICPNGLCFYWHSLYIPLFNVHSMYDIAFYKQLKNMFTDKLHHLTFSGRCRLRSRSFLLSPSRPTQPPTLSRMGKWVPAKGGDALWLGSKGRMVLGSLHFQRNVWWQVNCVIALNSAILSAL